jgi:hypothetical protein
MLRPIWNQIEGRQPGTGHDLNCKSAIVNPNVPPSQGYFCRASSPDRGMSILLMINGGLISIPTPTPTPTPKDPVVPSNTQLIPSSPFVHKLEAYATADLESD